MLSKTLIREAREPGKHRDDNNLYLVIPKARPAGGTWQFIYSIGGRSHSMGLGKRTRNAEDVRAEARAARKLLEAGIDPLDYRATEIAAEQQRRAHATTFSVAAASYIAAHETGWRSAVVRRQWRNTLAAYAAPLIGELSVSEINTEHVLAILNPIWTRIPDTADNLRLRIERVLDYAKARGWRDGENPATWRGHLRMLLPAKGRLKQVRHHAALDWREAPAFHGQLTRGARESPPAPSNFSSSPLCALAKRAARSGMKLTAKNAVWTVPPRRENNDTGMKGGQGRIACRCSTRRWCCSIASRPPARSGHSYFLQRSSRRCWLTTVSSMCSTAWATAI